MSALHAHAREDDDVRTCHDALCIYARLLKQRLDSSRNDNKLLTDLLEQSRREISRAHREADRIRFPFGHRRREEVIPETEEESDVFLDSNSVLEPKVEEDDSSWHHLLGASSPGTYRETSEGSTSPSVPPSYRHDSLEENTTGIEEDGSERQLGNPVTASQHEVEQMVVEDSYREVSVDM